MRKTIIGIGMGALLACPAPARGDASRVGTTAANFLAVGSGAGILGMGGAALGLGGGLDASAWNVGALGWLDVTELALSHAGLTEESAQEWVAAGGRIGTSSFRWAASGLYQGEGGFEGRDESNRPTGSLGLSSLALGAGLARRFGSSAAAGLGVKWIQEDLAVARGSGIAFDAGALFRIGMIGFGVAAQNVGGRMSFGSRDYPLPASVGAGLGIAHAASGLRAGVDLNVPNAYYRNLRGGAEWTWRRRVALRAGYRAELGAPPDEALSGPSFGAGAGARGLWIDYGYLLAGNGGGQHRMGVSFRPGPAAWSGGEPFGPRNAPRELGAAPPAESAGAGKRRPSGGR